MESITKYQYSKEYHFQVDEMDKETFIYNRLDKEILSNAGKKAYENILRFLYQTKYDQKVNRSTNKKYINFLTPVEKIMLFRLETRCSGSQRYTYGINSVLALKRAKYKCEVCGEKDIRCLEIDHKNGRKKPIGETKYVHYEIEEFQCLCANHHKIKTVVENQQTNQ
jgi:hypothetical protein